MPRVPITVAFGDGVGPEIMEAVIPVLEGAGAELDIEVIEIGEKVYRRGSSAGIEPASWESLRRTKVFLKSPITTPQGGGFKSLNVTTRTSLGLFANVRPCTSYYPFVRTKHPKMDLVIIRENEEDTYAGIEYRQSQEMYQCLKLISRPGCEKIIRYAFEYARRNNRRKVSCFSKDNIMKLTDGLFHKVFDEIGGEYPELAKDHFIIDIGTARIAERPEIFDVIVTLNLYGDIISDVAAEVAGSVGMAGSANIGDLCAMFEAIHGSAPDIAGKNVANPSGLLNAAVMMLVHIGQSDAAQKVHNAWLRTIEDGIHTADVFDLNMSKEKVGTRQFAQAVIERLGQEPAMFPAVRYQSGSPAMKITLQPQLKQEKELVGVDVFLDWDPPAPAPGTAFAAPARDPGVLGKKLEQIAGPEFKLKMIANRGVKVYPDGMSETFCTDHWRCRFTSAGGDDKVTHKNIIALLARVDQAGLDCIKTENLYNFNGERGYSRGQG